MISERILVVDDDPRIIKSINLYMTDYEITSFSNGQDALDFLKKPHNVRLVLLDVLMNGMNGLDVLKAIKSMDKRITVLMITAYGTKDVAIQALRNRADDLIEKPFDMAELRAKIHYYLRTHYVRDGKTSLDPSDQIEKIKRYLERDNQGVSLNDIAKKMDMSPKYMSRLFKEKTNFGFREYQIHLKIERSKELLSTTLLNVNEISAKLGYQNPESFMRLFKRTTGYTPDKYRREFINQFSSAEENKI